MSPDIVYTLCPYLDLASMFSLAAAYPIWSNMVHKYVKKLEVELMLKCELNGDILSCYELRNKQWELISKSIWKEVPSGVLDVDAINVFQGDASPISEDVCALLAKITTSSLKLSFYNRFEARWVLRTISFRPHSHLELHDRSTGPDLEPILVQSEISRFEWIVYTGNMHTLFNDLVEALETEKAIIRYKGIGHSPDSAWLVSALEGYLAAKPHQVRCVRRDATEYEIERRVPGRDAARSTAVQRTIKITGYPSLLLPLALERSHIVRADFTVENSF